MYCGKTVIDCLGRDSLWEKQTLRRCTTFAPRTDALEGKQKQTHDRIALELVTVPQRGPIKRAIEKGFGQQARQGQHTRQYSESNWV